MSLRTNTSFAALEQIIRGGTSFAIVSHYRPDGDALGSSLALGLAIRNLGKTVRVINEDGMPSNLKFLPGSDIVEKPQPGQTADAEIVFAVDCANRERLGANCLSALAGARQWINIDHHVSNEGYGDLHYIDPRTPATGEIMFEFLTDAGFSLTKEIAENLYVAISTDTGSFQYSGTTARTYEIGAALIHAGVNVSQLARDTYENHPLRRVELLRGLLNTMQITHEGRVASWALTRDLADRVGMMPEDAEGLIDILRSIQGVIVAAAFEELPGAGENIRLSLRSKDPTIDVGRVCALFGGGGHPMAAGARLAGPLSDAQSRLFQALHETLP